MVSVLVSLEIVFGSKLQLESTAFSCGLCCCVAAVPHLLLSHGPTCFHCKDTCAGVQQGILGVAPPGMPAVKKSFQKKLGEIFL